MFIGHFGLAFAAKRAAPSTSLAALLAASAFVDILWPAFLLMGLESVRIVPGITVVSPYDFVSYPYTHSLLMGIVWGIVFGGIYRLLRGSGRGAVVLGLLVVSHWFLDAIVHRPDLPLYPGGSERIGLGLWNSLIGTVVVEGLIFIIGVWMYFSCTRPLDWIGRYVPWALIVFLAAPYVGEFVSPPPTDITGMIYGAFIGSAVSIFLAWWGDRHRAFTGGGATRAGW